MKFVTYLIIVTCWGLLAGCAATMLPVELFDARQAYAQASAGRAARLAPLEVQRAREALAIAEKSFQDDPGSKRTRDLAILAYHQAKLAEALAGKTTIGVESSGTETVKRR